MLKATFDEGYLFDVLAILKVKYEKRQDPKILENYTRLSQEIITQIGESKFNWIVESQNFSDLIRANRDVFNLISQAQTSNDQLAQKTDQANYERFLVKTKLQKVFFESTPIEVKIGYV